MYPTATTTTTVLYSKSDTKRQERNLEDSIHTRLPPTRPRPHGPFLAHISPATAKKQGEQ